MVDGGAGLFLGAVALGIVHGIEPGHGWPVAASYALDQANKWAYGLAASLILGIGHLISSITMVAVFFYAKSYFNLTQLNEPIHPVGNLEIGGPVSLVAGVLLVGLGVREYRRGHTHDPGTGEAHSHDHAHGPEHGHQHAPPGRWGRLKRVMPFVGGHARAHGDLDDAADRGLWGIAWFAFLLGFAHEEEFEIIALCAGSHYCLELMTLYALTVIMGIVGLTLILIAGYEHFERRVDQYTPYLPAFSATILILMGLGFITGIL